MLQHTKVNSNGNRILAETFLKFGEVYFYQLLEKLPAGAYTCDREGHITYFNDHAAQLWGRRPSLNDPVDRFCGSFKIFTIDGEPMKHDECWMAKALIENQGFNGCELIIEKPDGKKVTALAHANPIHDESGELIGAVNVLVDITDRKLAEDALKESNRSKNEFIATLAHELRNPLSPVRNAIKILQSNDIRSAETEWAIDVLDRQTKQITRLVDDLMDVARISSNKLEISRKPVELSEILDAAQEVSRPYIEERGQIFTVTYPKNRVFVKGDLTRLTQAVSNLLNNAAKYTNPGGNISLTGEIIGGEAVISIEDTGIGISSKSLPRIFEMFKQAERSQGQSDQGLGIGLTLANRLIKMHGGTLDAQSEGVNKGSIFTVRLPVTSMPARSEPAVEVTESPGPQDNGTRILVVDDNQDCVESLSMILSMWGNDVRRAYDGLEAIKTFSSFDPRIVFLDIGMPGMNGCETARRIRELGNGTDVKLIALTGWGQKEDRIRSKEAGFDHHLTKPVDFDQLESLLAGLKT